MDQEKGSNAQKKKKKLYKDVIFHLANFHIESSTCTA